MAFALHESFPEKAISSSMRERERERVHIDFRILFDIILLHSGPS